MNVLDVRVQGADKFTFLKQGAIVTVTSIGRDPELPRYHEQAVVDIGSNSDRKRSSERPRRTYHSFELPGNGSYEVAVRHPGGIEVRIETFQEYDAVQRRSVTINAQHARGSNADDRTYDRVRPVRRGGKLDEYVQGSYPQASIVSSRYPGARLPPFPHQKSFRFADTKLGFRFLSRSVISDHDDVITSDEFADTFGSIVSPRFINLYDIYLDLQERPSKGGGPLPRWIAFSNGKGREVASIPWMWLPALPDSGRDVRIDIVESTASKGRSSVRILTHDTRWEALLAYVGAGRMNDAKTVADAVVKNIREESYGFGHSLPEVALRDKLKDPLVAALGGLVLVSSASDGGPKTWDEWIRNLANWFPGIPDGAAIYGYRLVQQGKFQEGHQWLHEAVKRGLPYFSATFRLLSLGFAQLEDDGALELISEASVAVDPTQTFTVMSLS